MMHFGIMEMQMDRLISADKRAGSPVDQVLNFDRGKLVEGLVQQGFKLIELGGDLGLFFPSAYRSNQSEWVPSMRSSM